MAKKKASRTWVWAPSKPPKPSVPSSVKAQVETSAGELVDSFLKPTYIKPPPKDDRFNYLIDITTKWHHSYFYFVSTYACPGSNALSPTFESPFARMEYIGNGRFNLAYMRYTGKWWELFQDLTLEESLETIRDQGFFHPA